MRKKSAIVFLLLAFTCQSAFAFYGARPMGMGGAFTAVADDANAPYWNPAGLALNPEVSITGTTKLNNRNTWVGDNLLSLKMCYETEMNPFQWILGIGIASLVAYERSVLSWGQRDPENRLGPKRQKDQAGANRWPTR